MHEYPFSDIDSVAVDPEHCHRCGSSLGTCEFEDFEANFVPLADLQANPDQIRDNDLERIEMAFEP